MAFPKYLVHGADIFTQRAVTFVTVDGMEKRGKNQGRKAKGDRRRESEGEEGRRARARARPPFNDPPVVERVLGESVRHVLKI